MNSSLSIIYLPGIGIQYKNLGIEWKMHRSAVREKIAETFEEQNMEIDLSEYNEGSPDFNILQRRDIYHHLNGSPCLIFFNYDTDELLTDIEIHNGIVVKTENIILSFDKEIGTVISELKNISPVQKTLDDDNVLFEDLKLVVASDRSMGGDDNNLGYIFMSDNIDHLIND